MIDFHQRSARKSGVYRQVLARAQRDGWSVWLRGFVPGAMPCWEVTNRRRVLVAPDDGRGRAIAQHLTTLNGRTIVLRALGRRVA